jgi:hypothetical protein
LVLPVPFSARLFWPLASWLPPPRREHQHPFRRDGIEALYDCLLDRKFTCALSRVEPMSTRPWQRS